MTNNTLFNLKTLFDPLSNEWEETDFQEKRDLISKIFYKSSPRTGFRSAALKLFLMEARDTNPLDDSASIEEYSRHMDKVNKENPEIPLNHLILAIGLYMNKSFMPDFNFPITSAEVDAFNQDMQKLKDGRTKRRKEIDDYIFEKEGNYGRELFDHLSHEGESTSIEEKRKKLKNAAGHGFSPAEFLFVYYYSYSSMEGYENVVKEAPLSAFELLWVDNKLMF